MEKIVAQKLNFTNQSASSSLRAKHRLLLLIASEEKYYIMARGNQRDQAREKNQKEQAGKVFILLCYCFMLCRS